MDFASLFTDLYELTMAQSYYQSGKADDEAVFELFFRRCPLGGEYVVVAGYDNVRKAIDQFKFHDKDIAYLQSLATFKTSPPEFFQHLKDLHFEDLEIRGFPEGSLVFANEPILQVKGPLLKCQLLESVLLNVVNFASLVATEARRIWTSANGRRLMEFGMRRAQGPNGAMIASRSSFIGGFDSTSNTWSGQVFGIPISGTMAHSFVQSFNDIEADSLVWNGTPIAPLLEKVKIEDENQPTHRGELGAFLAYAKTFPHDATFLVDTYDTLTSGVPNAIRVMKILKALGYPLGGIRLDSGDIVYLSQEARKALDQAGLKEARILASNELDEHIISSLTEQGAKLDAFGVGTKLVTASAEPYLGGVFKLVEFKGEPRIKISQQPEKRTIPSAKQVYRLYGQDGMMLLDLMTLAHESAPEPHKDLLALHPKDPLSKAIVKPSKIEPMLRPLLIHGRWQEEEDLVRVREKSLQKMKHLRSDIARLKNPTPYKVSVSSSLKKTMEEIYEKESPPKRLG